MKNRWVINEKYRGSDIWIAFPDRNHWYLAPHDEMIAHAESYGYTKTKSWAKGVYSAPILSKRMREDLKRYRFESLQKVAEEAAEDAQ